MKIRNFVYILAVSLALAAYSTWVVSNRASSKATSSDDSVPATDIPLIRLAEARALWDRGTALFVDVRSDIDFQFGHIEGAISLPEDEFEKRFAALKPQLQRAGAIVVYCKNRDCGRSLWSALRLRQQGLAQVKIYPNGWNEWVNEGMPAYKLPR